MLSKLIISFTLLICCSAATAKTTYEILEPDPMVEIQNKLKTTNASDFMKTPRNEWTVFKGEPYPLAKETRERKYIPWYTTEFDTKDKDGNVIYPKGFTFNPLKFAKYPLRLVIFKLEHYEAIKHLIKPSDELIADSGDVIEKSEEIGRHIYLVEPGMKERLGLQVVPSIIFQDGEHFVIREINLEDLK